MGVLVGGFMLWMILNAVLALMVIFDHPPKKRLDKQ
jgi:hypothetical protein